VVINATQRMLWSVDLPALTAEVRSTLAGVTSPSGENYTLVDMDRTGPLLRQRSAISIYLDKVVNRMNIGILLRAVRATLTAMSSGMLILSYVVLVMVPRWWGCW